jgi:hypothetical protein
MERYAAQHRPARPRHLAWRVRTELFDDLDEAKRACDWWRRRGCRQSITEVETEQRWVRYGGDEWIRHDSETPSSGVAASR